MFHFRGFRLGNRQPYSQFGTGLLLNGILCILFGIAILNAPELLAYFVAIILLIAGASLLAAWWKTREVKKHWLRDS